ncbi:MAG TPA: hypothetical protein VJT73_03645 [Polyangiaceae bacterium]|nr:hypothetical protein [Polyangiaceae bacterium]
MPAALEVADDDDGKRWTFEVTDDERLLFPELAGVIRVHLVEDDHGFVLTEQEAEEITDVMPCIVGYSYEDGVYCPSCTRGQFGDALDKPNATDDESNPSGVVYATDEHPDWPLWLSF